MAEPKEVSNGEQGVCNIQPKLLDNKFLKTETTVFQTKYWFFSYHSQHGEPFSEMFKNLEPLKKLCEKYVWAEEYGKSGSTKHIQGAFVLFTKDRDTALRKYFANGVTLRKLRCFKLAFNYCIKERNRIESSEVIPELVTTIDEDDFYEWQENLRDMIIQKPDNRSIYWLWGRQGCGKTQFMKWCCVHIDSCVVLSGKPGDMKNSIVEYKKVHTNPPRVILSNIGFDSSLANIGYSGYEDIKDMCFYSGKYEGGIIVGNPPHLVIFANETPETENCKFRVIDLEVPTCLQDGILKNVE